MGFVAGALVALGEGPVSGPYAWRNMKTDPPPPDLRDILGWARYSGISTYHLTVAGGWIPDDPSRYDAELWMPLPPHPAPSLWPPEPAYDD